MTGSMLGPDIVLRKDQHLNCHEESSHGKVALLLREDSTIPYGNFLLDITVTETAGVNELYM